MVFHCESGVFAGPPPYSACRCSNEYSSSPANNNNTFSSWSEQGRRNSSRKGGGEHFFTSAQKEKKCDVTPSNKHFKSKERNKKCLGGANKKLWVGGLWFYYIFMICREMNNSENEIQPRNQWKGWDSQKLDVVLVSWWERMLLLREMKEAVFFFCFIVHSFV